MPAPSDASPPVRRLHMNGVDLSYVEQGAGAPVIFVHGAFLDHRYWEPQREAVGDQYRFLAYDWRYHGTAPWPDQGAHYTLPIHAADLVAIIRGLNNGPAHLVTLSAGGILGALVALEHPELVRSLILVEPALTALFADLPEAKTAVEQRNAAFQPIIAVAKAGDAPLAARMLFDLVNNQGAGAFDRQPATFRDMVLDNARTVPLLFKAYASGLPPALTRAALGRLTAPTLVVHGEHTAPSYALTNTLVLGCIPGSRRLVIPEARHLMSYQNPSVFNTALLHFLGDHSATSSG